VPPSKNDFLTALGAELTARDYRKVRKGSWSRDLASGYLGTIAIGWAPRAGMVDVQAGVRDPRVQDLVEALNLGPEVPFATVTRNLRNETVSSDPFGIRDPVEAMAESVASVIEEYGDPLQDRIDTPSALEDAVIRFSPRDWQWQAVPAIRAAAGDVPGALEILNGQLDELRDDEGVEAQDFRAFAEAFKRQVGSDR
jgi:hypothetical protein